MGYELGERATGVVVDVQPYGVFLELEDGSEGFVDAGGMVDPPAPIPDDEMWPKPGDVVVGRVVLTGDKQTRLSLRPADLAMLDQGPPSSP